MQIDAAVILNLHREAVFLKRTLLSMDDAVRFAAQAGLRLELVAVLDRADADTRRVLREHDLSLYATVNVIEADFGSLGLARNAGVQAASGEFIFTADGDDLVSENYFTSLYRTCTESGPTTLVFPEYVLMFGAEVYTAQYRSLTDATPFSFADLHPYISRLCAHRSVFQRIQYADLRLSRGYAYEDWHFNAECVAAGLDVKVVPGTILFYRRRPDSLLNQADALSTRQIPPSKLFEPTTYLKICQPYLGDPAPQISLDEVNRAARDFLGADETKVLIEKAQTIEPEIQLWRYQHAPIWSNLQSDFAVGRAYHTICRALERRVFDEVFLCPFVSRGGAERYLLAIMEAMYQRNPFREILVILGEDFDGHSSLGKYPPNVTVLNLHHLCASTSLEQRCLLALKIVQSSCPDARIHVRPSTFGDMFLKRFGSALTGRDVTYYRFLDEEEIEDGHMVVHYSSLPIISANLPHISRIVSDNDTTIHRDQHRIGLHREKWQRLYAPVEAPASIPTRTADACDHILWASRLDRQKRPTLLPLIAAALHPRKPELIIDAYGTSVFGHFDPGALRGFANLTYHGAYEGFHSLQLSKYSTFVYTSWCDGLPNVLLEAMAAGLIVVAPNVGGIAELVIDGETGILLPSLASDADMAKAYCDAIVRLANEPSLGPRLVQGASDLIRERHSWQSYVRRVADIFNLHDEATVDVRAYPL
ncbi:glycosyltransferase [Chelatococcus sp. GCM10030263]|uniref:glycosyltransferase n=1 Tax=Chelatococcus sp. GCM10030263 TaxID=3273387 RepID=UPI003618494F